MTGNLDLGYNDIDNAGNILGTYLDLSHVTVTRSIVSESDIISNNGKVEGKNLSSRGVVFVNNNQIRGVNDGSADFHAVNKRHLDKKTSS